MSQVECTCAPATHQLLCYASDRSWPESVQRGMLALIRASWRKLRAWLQDWHTGGRSADLIDSLNEAQLRDIGMADRKSRRDIERIRRENHLWHLPLQ